MQTKKAQGQNVSPNPYFAIDDNAYPPEPQTLSYAEYYARYHTTEARDGWHIANPTGEKVIYVKGG